MKSCRRIGLAVLLGICLFLGVSCGDASDGGSGGDKGGSGTATPGWQGTWSRQAVYVNGSVENTTPATLVLKETTYTSTGTCSVNGTVSVSGNTMTATISETDCPGGVGAGTVVTYTFELLEAGQKMTLTSGNTMEKYTRAGDVTGDDDDDDDDDTTGTEENNYCDASSTSAGTCTEFPSSISASDRQQYCTSAGGTLSNTACPTANRLGKCTLSSPAGMAVHYYGSVNAETACNAQGGTWEAAQ